MHRKESMRLNMICSVLALALPALLALSAAPATAQFTPPDPDWKELEAPAPPAFTLKGLVPVEVPRATLQYGVDPASVSLGADGIVRYVVVATSNTGAVNALYEGIRCSSAEVKVYARHNPDTGWTPASAEPWRPLHNNPSRHSLIIARTAACMGHSPNRSRSQIVRDLRSPIDTRFN
jgi:hypothetical protein